MKIKLYLGQEIIIKSLFDCEPELEFVVNKKTKAFATIQFYKYNLQMDIPSTSAINEHDICRIDRTMKLINIRKASYSSGTSIVRR